MNYESFFKLFTLIQLHMVKKIHSKSTSNGPISPMVHLGCALWYCAGGSAYNIALMFGSAVSVTIKLCQTKKMVAQFQAKSTTKIDCCVGAIYRILIWIHQPN